MKIFHSIDAFKTQKKTIVTIGTFDGVHVGHQKIIDKLIHTALLTDCESLILTFFPHPRMVLQEESEIKLLNTISERCSLLEKTGLNNLIVHPFDKEFSRLTAEEFVENVLVKKLNVQKIIIGHDHRFGRNRTASMDDLIVFGEKYGFEVEQLSAQEIQTVSVSSTKIRKALDVGNILLANEYLGYCYYLIGTVQKGKQLGRTIGFPTANLLVTETYKLLPKTGVYVVKSYIHEQPVFGIMNIGTNPTVHGKNLSIEIHYLNFNTDLYNQNLQVSLLYFIREEQKFDSIALLKKQLQKDVKVANTFLNSI